MRKFKSDPEWYEILVREGTEAYTLANRTATYNGSLLSNKNIKKFAGTKEQCESIKRLEGYVEDDGEKISRIYEEFKENFTGAFHSILWEIIVNKIQGDKSIAFLPIVDCEGYMLGIATQDEQGYTPTMAYFTAHDYSVACNIANKLNEAIFGIGAEKSIDVVLSTMRSFNDGVRK
jgi:hypothetical protein